jgi:hypothetical protein
MTLRAPLARSPAPRREPPTAEHMIDVLRSDLYALPFALLTGRRTA